MKTSKSAKKNLQQNKRIPRISTRGFYDLRTGKTRKNKPFDLYPKKFFDCLDGVPEITIMIHGLRNNKSGALVKFALAKQRLAQLGYTHPIVGFSYDSNTKGVQYKSQELHATKTGVVIAKKNGKNLAKFILHMKKRFPDIKIRLIGHSLGSQVILSTLDSLRGKKLVEAAYIFGASIPSASMKNNGAVVQRTVKQKFVNYYSKYDNVLKYASKQELISLPIGLVGATGKTPSVYRQHHVHPDNHRFVSYAKVLKSYP